MKTWSTNGSKYLEWTLADTHNKDTICILKFQSQFQKVEIFNTVHEGTRLLLWQELWLKSGTQNDTTDP